MSTSSDTRSDHKHYSVIYPSPFWCLRMQSDAIREKPDVATADYNVKYKKTDAPSLWHQQKSTTVDINGPRKTGVTRCPGGDPFF